MAYFAFVNTYRYYLFHKPYRVLCQFSRTGTDKRTLADFLDLPSDVYPFGRLDEDSEGLLLLSSERTLTSKYSSSGTEKEYWVQVEGQVEQDALEQLKTGVKVRIKGKPYRLKAESAKEDESLRILVPDRVPPIRYRKSVPDSWLRITLTEGKNRQIRRMTAAIGYPTLRLMRYRIGALNLDRLKEGECLELSRHEFLKAFAI